MNNGRLDFDYSELDTWLANNRPIAYGIEFNDGYFRCQTEVKQFFLDKLKLKVIKNGDNI